MFSVPAQMFQDSQYDFASINQTTMCLRNQGRTKGEGWSTAN